MKIMRHTYQGITPKGYKWFFGCPVMPGGKGYKYEK